MPTLCEAGNIRTLLDRVRSSLDPLHISYELIVVDDDSPDGTAAIVACIAQSDPRVRLFVRTSAHGLGGAVTHGWKQSDAEIVGVIDGDLQHPPELLPQLWKAIDSGADLALASRYVEHGNMRESHPVRRGLSHLAVWLTLPLQKAAIRVQDPMSGFFLVRRSCLRGVTLQTQGFKILLEILVRGRVASVCEVPFSFDRRRAGNSKAGIGEGLHYFVLLGRLCWNTLTTRQYSHPAPPAPERVP